MENFKLTGIYLIREAIPSSICDDVVANGKSRLNQSQKHNPTTGSFILPPTKEFLFEEYAPEAFEIIKELCGGIDRIKEGEYFNDNIIIRPPQQSTCPVRPSACMGNWHMDMDDEYYLDRTEAVNTFIAWDDVEPGAETWFAIDSPQYLVPWFAEHRVGDFWCESTFGPLLSSCNNFQCFSMKKGDMLLTSPFILHSAANNISNKTRYLNNGHINLRERLRFDREDYKEHSPLEVFILNMLHCNRWSIGVELTYPYYRMTKEEEYK